MQLRKVWTKASIKPISINLQNQKSGLKCARQSNKANMRLPHPHTAKIPKDNGDFRTVYINEPIDRVFLSIANDLLFELMPEMIHPSCLSYQKGIGCGKIVKDISCKICETKGEVIGWKSDFSKYFDSVPLRFIDEAFDSVEDKWGHSAIIDVLRKYYHSDWYFDTDGKLQKFLSVAKTRMFSSFLAC